VSTCPEFLTYKAPAKLNLGLRVTGRRPDGYHELASLFWPLDICDDISLSKLSASETGDVSLNADWAPDAPIASDLPRGNENLVIRAVRYSGMAADIRLSKRIPIGGGLGGGSSDAGSTLRALANAEWIAGLRAHNLAQELGADVPFFLNPKPSWITGVGERQKVLTISPELLAKLHFVLVLLPRPCSTAEVFSRFKGAKFSAAQEFPVDFVQEADLMQYFASAGNDLTAPAMQICPEIGTVIDELKKTPAWYADMSGSGSTCFGVYPSASLAHEAAQVVEEKCRSLSCKSLVARTFV
jgi:4-diphosphocytidyl-2-C-methyl-D-erythritol kinase